MRARFLFRLVAVAALTLASGVSASRARADDATAQARSHYEMGLKLFDGREHEQALIEFRQANQLKPRPAALFMMAQCEYLLGHLKEARAHYETYVTENPTGEFVELGKDRIQSIEKRPSTFVINTVPDDVTVRLREVRPEGAAATTGAAADVTGQAPNNFQIPRGRYRIDVTKKDYQGQTRIVDVDVAETKPLFFKLDPIPARLEIETAPELATLYVNGNRARNPYRQDVAPGAYEVFAEAPDHEGRTITLSLSPGENRRLLGPDALRLPYAQRSGRPELIVASALIGGFVGAGAVAAAIGEDLQRQNVSSVLLVSGGGLVGAVAGALVATPLVPRYVTDNRALFILGAMWIGAAEGAGVGIIGQQAQSSGCEGPAPCRSPLGLQLRSGFIGSLPGLALGLTAGSFLADSAPTYGRVAIIQSAAFGGVFVGGLVQMTAQWKPYGDTWESGLVERTTDVGDAAPAPNCKGIGVMDNEMKWSCPSKSTNVLDLTPGALIGLNVGLVAGILATHWADKSKYGPSWKRVLLVDLAAGAGLLAGGIAGCVANKGGCLIGEPKDDARAQAAATGLAGGALGLLGGLLLTRHMDDEAPPSSRRTGSLTLVPTSTPGSVLPGLTAFGSF